MMSKERKLNALLVHGFRPLAKSMFIVFVWIKVLRVMSRYHAKRMMSAKTLYVTELHKLKAHHYHALMGCHLKQATRLLGACHD